MVHPKVNSVILSVIKIIRHQRCLCKDWRALSIKAMWKLLFAPRSKCKISCEFIGVRSDISSYWDDFSPLVLIDFSRLQRFEKTNEMLLNCNALSNGRLKAANDDFKAYGKVIIDMKKDLDYIFKKIRVIKGKVANQYPDAVKQMENKKKNVFSEEADEEDEGGVENNGNQADVMLRKHPNESSSTVNYVQMNARQSKAKSFDESTDNESSDCMTDT